ncbi:MAG TPA: hypothetical protein VMF06_21365 [Candidatus Limnocylindria bacterium]|jgi:hypothetical protein|nr:hypothetical protein [Candidatus Limnocylindria bacterium]
MKRRGLQLSRRHRWTLYTFSVVLLVSGAIWAWAHYQDESGTADPLLRGIAPWLLKVHGLAAMGFVLLLGTLIPVHIRHSWHANKNRVNGVFFLTAVGLLTVSGYLLYYLGDETVRGYMSRVHLWLGLAAPLLLGWHIFLGRRATAWK